MELTVREMKLDEAHIRVDYFVSATPEYLEFLGADEAKLPSREDWLAFYRGDYARPIEQRESFLLLWLGDGKPIGFSSVDKLAFGKQANMHLHVLEFENRNAGIGAECVRQSVVLYFELLKLEKLFCQPNAFNTAPNRTLQKVGFKFVKTYETAPSEINFVQPINQWVIKREQLAI